MAIVHLKDGSLDCGASSIPRRRMIVNDDGDTVYERLPTMEFWRALDPQGNVKNLGLHPGSGKPGTSGGPNLDYKRRLLEVKKRAGWVDYHRCPKADGSQQYLPKDMRGGHPCTQADDGQAIGMDRSGESHPCPCVVAIEKARKAKNAKENTRYERRYSSDRERARKESTQGAADLAVVRLSEAIGAAVGGKAKKDIESK